MFIAIDANILIEDLWLRSQNMRVLLDFAKKTQSIILLHEVVEAEVKAKAQRKFMDAARTIKGAITEGEKLGIVATPSFSYEESIQQTVDRWQQTFDAAFNSPTVRRLPITISATQESIRRVTERIPPCNEKGDGIRDTMIWIGILEFYQTQQYKPALCFISRNTRDFGDKGLRSELQRDINEREVALEYLTSLDLFIAKYVNAITPITMEWINERISLEDVERIISSYIGNYAKPSSEYLFRIQDDNLAEIYRLTAKLYPESMSISGLELDDFSIWDFSDQHIELRLKFVVDIEMDIEGEWVDSPRYWSNRSDLAERYRPRSYQYLDRDDDDDDDWLSDRYPRRKTISCFAELAYEIAAEISHDTIVLLTTEDVYRR